MAAVLFDDRIKVATSRVFTHRLSAHGVAQILTVAATRDEGEKPVYVYLNEYDVDVEPMLILDSGDTKSWSGRIETGETLIVVAHDPHRPYGEERVHFRISVETVA